MASMTSVKKKYATVYSEAYTEEFPCILRSNKGSSYVFCSICCVDFSILHKGKGDITGHLSRQKHQTAVSAAEQSKKIDQSFFQKKDDYSVIRAEALFTAFLVEHNLPLSAADHVGPLLKRMFPDSNIAMKYSCARTKTTSIVGEMAKKDKMAIVENMKKNTYAISTDGSNKGDKKLYPIVATYYNINNQMIETSLLSVPVLERDGTGENIAKLILDGLKSMNIPLENCLSLGADNAPVMIGKKAGVAAFLMKEMPHLFIQGCLCHLINLAAEKGAACLPIDVDEAIIDVFYYLEKSVKRKETLKKFQALHDLEARKILKHVPTRWLSLGRCLKRLVEQWDPLISFFREESQNKIGVPSNVSLQDYRIPKKEQVTNAQSKVPDASAKKRPAISIPSAAKKIKIFESSEKKILSRAERIFMFISSNENKAFVLFLLNTLPIFEKSNIALQTKDPKIHIVKYLLLEMFKSLLSRFVIPSVIKNSANLLDVDYHTHDNQKIDEDLVVGEIAHGVILSLSDRKRAHFYSKVREYFVKACDYMRYKFPFHDEVLVHSEVADLDRIDKMSFASIRYFVKRFPVLLKTLGSSEESNLLDELQAQFCSAQVEEIPDSVKSEERIDVKWMKFNAYYESKYTLLSRFMVSLLILPHSNAECERIFSYVTKTQTQFRSQLSSQTLENLLTVKSNMTKFCHKQNFDNNFLKKAKSATTASNSSF